MEYKTDSLAAFYGLMPQSISHEGYSAKPMHSYWDDFFTFRGLKDASEIALILNERNDYLFFKKLRDEFQENLINSIKLTIKNHNIDYIPGCVELGDFDPTSTSIAFFPINIAKFLPKFELKNTFEKYYQFLKNREGRNDFVNFTPYEIRNINSFLFLDEYERAFELLEFLLKYQRPSNWLHWAEVVWNDSTKPDFIGDMPHTWVGSDFINAFRNMFVYEQEDDSTILLFLGFDERFLDRNNQFKLSNLITLDGILDCIIKKISDSKFEISLKGNLPVNKWKFELKNFTRKNILEIKLNDKILKLSDDDRIVFNEFPAMITLTLKR